MTVLGLIPARGGSKGVPGKNLIPLSGRPLIAYTCEAARSSARLTRVIASTDDGATAEYVRREGIEVPFMRPAALAADDTPMIAVMRHAIAEMERAGERFDAVALLQPTSPLRRAADIDAAIDLMQRTGADTVVSVVPVPHNFTPASLMRAEGDMLLPLEGASGPLRRQDKPRLFARNGPAVLVVTRRVIDSGRFYEGKVAGYVMDAAGSVDIDTIEDFAEAELRLARRAAAGEC